MSVLNQSGEEQVECPLCMEPLEVDDLNFFPCTCGYQICRFCWHRIRTDENGLCPACRKAYPENPADFKPLSQEEVAKLKAEKRQKDQQRKQKITENRKHLANVRVVQRNLVFVVGLPMRLADSEVLKKHEYFGKFGKIHKVVINQSTSYAGTQGPSASAYVTYQKGDDALRAIQAVNNIVVDGRPIKSSLGTTKYCSHFMKNQACPKADCMYLHDHGDQEASFTKEEMQQGKHQEYERKLHEHLINASNQRERKPTPSPPAVSLAAGAGCGGANPIAVTAAITCLQAGQTGNKEAWPSLQPGLGTNSGGSSTSGSSNGTTKGETGRKQSSTKNPNLSKKRHSSGDDIRGKTKDKQLYNPDDQDCLKLSGTELENRHSYLEDETPSSSLETQSTSESVSLDSDDGGGGGSVGGKCDVISSTVVSAARLAAMTGNNRTATLFEPDNNSFFSSNSFTKITACTQGSGGSDWPINGLTQTHFPDDLQNLPVHTTEDWQAAFSSHIVVEKDTETALQPPHAEDDRAEELNDDQNVTSKFNGDITTGPLENIPTSKFILEDYRNDKIAYGDGNPSHIFNSLHSQFGQDPNLYMVNRQHQFLNSSPQQSGHTQLNSQHLVPNGLPPTQATSKFLAEFHSRQQSQLNHLEPNSLLGNSHLESSFTKNHLDPSKYPKNLQNMHLDSSPNYLVNSLQSHNIEGTGYGNSHMGGSHSDSSSYGNGSFNPGLAVSNGLMSSQNGRLQNGDILGDENGFADSGSFQRKANDAEKYLDYQRKMNPGDFGGEILFDDFKYGKCDDLAKEFGIGDDCSSNDDLGFDPFHETQKGFAEIMGREGGTTGAAAQKHHETHRETNHFGGGSYQHTNHSNNPTLGFNHVQAPSSYGGSKLLPTLSQQQMLAQQNHRLSGNVSGCTKLLEGLGLGPTSNSVPTRTRLPPPGFSTAPNHMNAFGLGIPRAPTNNGSKILPFMGLGSSNGGSLSPVPPPQQQQQQQQSMLFERAQTIRNFPMPNGLKISGGGDPAGYSVKDWSENLRGLIPLSGGFSQGPNTASPPPTQTQHSTMFSSHHNPHSNSKGWTGPCTDWTALDPAIVSSSRSAPHSNLPPHGGPNPLLMHTNPLLSQHVQNNSTHWLRNLEENNSLYFGGQLPDWSLGNNSSSLATPPPGFSARQQSKALSATADMTKIENL